MVRSHTIKDYFRTKPTSAAPSSFLGGDVGLQCTERKGEMMNIAIHHAKQSFLLLAEPLVLIFQAGCCFHQSWQKQCHVTRRCWLLADGSAAPAFHCAWYLQTPSFTLGKGQPGLQLPAAVTSAAVCGSASFYVLREASPAQAPTSATVLVLSPTGAAAITVHLYLSDGKFISIFLLSKAYYTRS